MNDLRKSALELRANLNRLSEKDVDFAISLLTQLEARGSLSSKQEFWVGKLLDRATAVPDTGPKVVGYVGDLFQINLLFKKAEAKLVQPSVVLMWNGWLIRLKHAGQAGRHPNCIHVVSAEGDHEDRVYFGRITPEGTFIESPKRKGNHDMQGLLALLKRFAADPARMATEHGRLTGKCAFCNTGLTDERSTAVGYGRTCARNYDLPWGVGQLADRVPAQAAMF